MIYRCPNDRAPLVAGGTVQFCPQCHGAFDPVVLAMAATAAAERELPKSSQVFVRRSEELAALWRAFTDACEQRTPQVVLLRGPAGIGKTAILERFYQQIASSEIWDPDDYWPDVLAGRLDQISEPDRADEWSARAGRAPLFMWFAARCNQIRSNLNQAEENAHDASGARELDAWGHLLESTEVHRDLGKGRWRSWLPSAGELFKEVALEGVGSFIPGAGLIAAAAGAVSDRMRGRDRRIEKALSSLDETAARVFARMADVDADGMPVILAFDDLQWADDKSLETTLAVLEHARGRPLMIVATVRSVDVKAEARPLLQLMDQLERRRGDDMGYRVVDVDRLGEDSIVEQLRLLLGASADADAIRWIAGKADGMPLFADELARLTIAEALLDNAGQLAPGRSLDELDAAWTDGRLPNDLRGVIGERLRRLRDRDWRQHALIAFGAVEGRRFRDRTLERVVEGLNEFAELDLDAIRRRLDDAEKTHDVIQAEDAQVSPKGERVLPYVYTHGLLHDAFLRSLRDDERIRCLEALIDIHAAERKAAGTSGTRFERIARAVGHDLLWRQLAALRTLTEDECGASFQIAAEVATLKHGAESHQATYSALVHAHAVAERWAETSPQGRGGRAAALQIATSAADVLREMGRLGEARERLEGAADVAFGLYTEARDHGLPDEVRLLRDRVATILGQLREVVTDVGSRSDLAVLARRYDELVAHCAADVDDGAWQIPFNAAMLRGRLAYEHEGADAGRAEWTRGWRLLEPIAAAASTLSDASFYALAGAYHELLGQFSECNDDSAAAEVTQQLATLTGGRLETTGAADAARIHVSTMYLLGTAHERAADADAELAVLREAVDISRGIADADTSLDDVTPGQGVIVALWTLASALSRTGAIAEAVDTIEEALSMARDLENRHPVQDVIDGVDTALSYAVHIAKSIGDTVRARELIEERIRTNRRHAGRFGSATFRSNLLNAQADLIWLLVEQGDSWAARKALAERVALAREAAEAGGGFRQRRHLIAALIQAAPILLELGDTDSARALAREALGNAHALAAESPNYTDCDWLDTAMSTYANVLAGLGDRSHALVVATERLAQNRRWLVAYGRRMFEYNELYAALQLASLHVDVGELGTARDVLGDARASASSLVDDLGDQSICQTLNNILATLGTVLCELGDFEAASTALAEGVRRGEEALERGFQGAEGLLGDALFCLGDYHRKYDSDDRALDCFNKMVELLEPSWEAGDRTPAMRNLVWGPYWLATTANQQGDVTSAMAHATRCLDVATELAEHIADVEADDALAAALTLSGIVNRERGSTADALVDFARAVDHREKLADHIGTRQARIDAASAQIELARAHRDARSLDLAIAALERAEHHRAELCDEASDNAEAIAGLATVYRERAVVEADRGNLDAAASYCDRALEHVELAAEMGGLFQRRYLREMLDYAAQLFFELGRADRSLELRRREVDVARAVADEAGDLTSREAAVKALATLASALDDDEEILATLDECLARARSIEADLATPGAAELVCDALERLADHRAGNGDVAGALALVDEEAARLRSRAPGDVGVRRSLGRTLLRAADLRASLADDAGVAAAHDELLGLVRAAAEQSDDPWSLTHLVNTLCAVADRHFEAGRHTLSRALYAETIELGRRLTEQLGPNGLHVLSSALHSLAVEHQLHGELDEAASMFDELIEVYRELGDRGNPYNLLSALGSLGEVHRRRGDTKRAEAAYRERLERARTLADSAPKPDARSELHMGMFWLGDLLMDTGLREESAALLGELADAHVEQSPPAMVLLADLHELHDAPALSLPLRERAVEATVGDEPRVHARALARQAETLRRAGDPEGAARIARDAATTLRAVPGDLRMNRTINNAIVEAILYMCEASRADSTSLPRDEIVALWDAVPATDLVRAWERDLRARFDAHEQPAS